jgi:tetraacyldisaccharide 4'-kinase
MRTAPAFWAEPPGILADLLLPIGVAWDAAGRLRRSLSRPYRPSIPVICVGNLVAGGAGKTPVAAALACDLAARGVAVHIVTRGYGGRLGGPVQVDAARHDASQIGDEAPLLSVHAPCWVARDRAAGIRAAIAAGARVIVLDDGFQNPAIAKTLSLVVVDARYGFGNSRVIPAGPLRESLARGLARADALVLLGTEAETGGSPPCQISVRLPVLRAVLSPVGGERLTNSRLLAFAGIARPEKFFGTLRELGADLVGARPFPDHHRFRTREIEQLLREAERAQARLVTTAKDIVRVPPASRSGIEVLEVVVRWRDPDAIAALIKRVLGNQCPHRLFEGNYGERS